MTRAIKLIFSAYRKDDYADAKGFVAQLGTILQSYPSSVVDFISSPMTGIQRKSKFPPSIAEIVEAANERLGYEVAVQKNLLVKAAERRKKEKPFVPPSAEEDEKIRKGFHELLGKFKEKNVVTAELNSGRRR